LSLLFVLSLMISDKTTAKLNLHRDVCPDNEELSEFILEMKNLVSNLKHKGGSNPQAIWDMADQGGITLGYLKSRKREKNPSFSNTVWKDVVPKFGLDPGKDYYQLDNFSFPVTSLPPSFHRNVMAWSGKWLDVYQERGVQKKEAARVRLMDAVRTILASLSIARQLTAFLSGTYWYAPSLTGG
jgi:hypothetical protein